MKSLTGLTAKQLLDYGLKVYEGKSIAGGLVYERPAFILDPRRIKNCKVGAFTYFNGHTTSSMYATEVGRYGQIGESCIIGPPEHPMDWFSTHMFTFAPEQHLPRFFELPDAAALGTDGLPPTPFNAPLKTVLGHDSYVGAGSFVKRGVTIGIGAVVAARAVVTRDVPPYAIVAGTPAKVMRLRLPEKQIARLLQLEWWRYDLAPHKKAVDFAKVEATLDYLEQSLAEGKLQPLRPDTYRVTRNREGFDLEQLPEPLYYP
jgi:acetyltransferase-like isoleucine patch superfamily enzyme